MHKRLIEELRAPLAGSKTRQSLESQVDVIIKAVAPSLKAKNYPGFYSELRTCLKSLLQSHALGVEDLIDVLTLIESTLDFAIALQLIENTKVLSPSFVFNEMISDNCLSFLKSIPEASRRSAFRTIWRRIYIHDE